MAQIIEHAYSQAHHIKRRRWNLAANAHRGVYIDAVSSIHHTKKTIRLQMTEKVRDLIDRGAAAAHKTRSEFILESSAAAAQEALLDQCHFFLTPAQMSEFRRIIEAPLSGNVRLHALLASSAPWVESDPKQS